MFSTRRKSFSLRVVDLILMIHFPYDDRFCKFKTDRSWCLYESVVISLNSSEKAGWNESVFMHKVEQLNIIALTKFTSSGSSSTYGWRMKPVCYRARVEEVVQIPVDFQNEFHIRTNRAEGHRENSFTHCWLRLWNSTAEENFFLEKPGCITHIYITSHGPRKPRPKYFNNLSTLEVRDVVIVWRYPLVQRFEPKWENGFPRKVVIG